MNWILKKFDTVGRIAREKGVRGIRNKLAEIRRIRETPKRYAKWMAAHAIDDAARAEIRAAIAAMPRRPLISVVMPVYDIDEKWLRRCIDTVFAQIYENWEFCIADDNSPSPHVRRVLEEYAARDARVKVVFRAENGHISKASNSALELATGEFAVLLDHDDELTEDALFRVAEAIVENPEIAFIYSDEDMIDESGRRYDAKFKPDFSRELLYSLNLITHLSAYRTSILREIGGFRVGAEGSQDYDLALRFLERVDESQIRHIPRILYHWRAVSGSVALSSDEKPYAHERAREALRAHLARTGRDAEVTRGVHQFHRVRYRIPQPAPRVAVIAWPHGGVTNATRTHEYANATVVTAAAATAEALNAAARSADAEVICFVRGDLAARDTGWLAELASFALRPDIGAVGGKILDEFDTIAQAGVVFGVAGLAGASHRGYADDSDGCFARLNVVNNYSAVTADCLAVRRALFDELGGFDAAAFPDRLFDLDFCLSLRARGFRNVFTPYAVLKGPERVTEIGPELHARFLERWRATVERDPFYNPNLAADTGEFLIKV